MTRALRAELIKLRTTRTFVALVGAALGLSLLVAVLIAALSKRITAEDARSIVGGTDTSALFILLLGAIGIAGEWRHRTIASSVLAVPDRLRLLAAKVVSYAAAGVVLSLVVNVVVMAVVSLVLSSRGMDTLSVSDLADVLWRNLLIAAFFGAVGVCVGALVRNPAGAIVLLLVVQFVVDPALFGLAHDVWRFSPMGGVPAGVNRVGRDADPVELGVAIALMAAWIAVLYTAAAAMFTRRDLV
jgi:ABC-2 type transport system permease protein